MSELVIRGATPADAEAVVEIYAPIVEHTAISFEAVPPGVDEMMARIEATNGSHAWLVAERGAVIAGYAYGTSHRTRHAYRFSTEVSVYVHEHHRGAGVGLTLYRQLFEALAQRGYFHAYAGITQPNEASSALHQRAGFNFVGTFPQVGYKFGRWHDVAWWHRTLRTDSSEEGP